jgi:hypothetical protein
MEILLTFILGEAVKKFPECFHTDGLVHRESEPPGQSVTGSGATSGIQGQWFLHRATHHPATALSGSRCSLPQGDTSQWITHRATHHPATALSGSRCSLPQEDTSQWITHRATHHPATAFSGSRCSLPHNHGGHRMECEGRTAEDSNRSLPPGLPAVAGSMEQVCVCVRAR